MRRALSHFPSKVLSYFPKLRDIKNSESQLYEEHDYLTAYSRHTDLRVQKDPHGAVGGNWEQLGKLQFQFVTEYYLLPSHYMLDIGCGTLRGGRHFIRYLHPNRYFGLDISPKALEFGRKLIADECLSNKSPTLILSRNKNMKFFELSGQEFDLILAQSVFTHLMPSHIEECIQHIGRLMHTDTVFLFTYFEASDFRQSGLKDFRYPQDFFWSLAEQNGFSLKDRSAKYPHPRGQKMVELRRRGQLKV
jgi:SAM-dependent methyltransferase